jgi:hypothetical protein
VGGVAITIYKDGSMLDERALTNSMNFYSMLVVVIFRYRIGLFASLVKRALIDIGDCFMMSSHLDRDPFTPVHFTTFQSCLGHGS